MLQKQPILVKNEIFLTQINKSRKILIRNLKSNNAREIHYFRGYL